MLAEKIDSGELLAIKSIRKQDVIE